MNLVIYGGGGHAKVVIDCLQASGQFVNGIVDNKYSGDLLGVPRFKTLPPELLNSEAIIAIGDNSVRRELSLKSGQKFSNAIHSSAIISSHAHLGKGCMILHRAVIQAGVTLGDHIIINTAAQVDHDCTIHDYAHIAPGAVLCGAVSVGEGTLIGAGSVIKPGVRIGAWVTVGSGSVIIKDIPDNAVVVGNPGRIIKHSRV